MNLRPFFTAVVSLALMALFGCGGGGGGATSTTFPPGTTTLGGVAAKGPLNGADISVFPVKADGTVDRNTTIGTGKTTTDGSGSFNIALTTTPTGPVVIEVSGGTFTDEASGASVTMAATTKLRTVVSTFASGDKVAVTPLTDLAYKKVEGIGSFTQVAIDDANTRIGKTFSVDNIVRSMPFDPTKAAPPTATADEKKYAAALGIISQMVNDEKGTATLADALGNVLTKLETEMHDNGGFSPDSVSAINTAITGFSKKNQGGTVPLQIVFQGGVLTVSTTGNLAVGTAINGIDFTVTMPAGVTVKADAVTGEAAQGVVQPSSQAVTNSIANAKFTPASATGPATLHVVILNVQPGFATGEFTHVNFDGFPTGSASFTVTVNQVSGANDPKASPATLSGITAASTISGL